jgi:hypothetical protein
MRALSLANPVEWSVRASRGHVLPGTDTGEILLYLGALVLFVVAMTAFASRCFRVYQRTM